MKLQRINEAEAIIEPFWDGGTSEYIDPDNRYKVLSEYEIYCDESLGAKIVQNWTCANFSAQKKAQAGQPAAYMQRKCNICVEDFDEFLIFARIPKSLALNVYIALDGKTVQIAKQLCGKDETGEFHLPLNGKMLEGIKVEFLPTEDNGKVDILWFGLANSAKVRAMQERPTAFGSEWHGFFKQPDFKVQNALFFNDCELDDLRKKLHTADFAPVYAVIKKQAEEYMQIEPEQYIGKYIHYPDRRWCRDRHMNPELPKFSAAMETLAFVGLIEQSEAMLKMAARHAISISHCEHWCESEIGVFPGASWHHRSFTEAAYCRAAALVLDWAGSILTPHAKQLIWDAMAMKGLPRIESDFKKIEYIREMNQGVVFSGGRIIAYLSLAQRYPRYKSNVEEAESDILSILANYIGGDGGTLEGPGYAIFTLYEAMPALYALAKKSDGLQKYNNLLSKTGEFMLSMLSLEEHKTTVMPINDCHPQKPVPSALAACFYHITKNSEWQKLYWRLVNSQKLEADCFSLILSVPRIDKAEADDIFSALPKHDFYTKTGQLNSLRQGRQLTTNLHYCTGPTYWGHFNEDKGSFIFESEGKVLCPDLGMCYYHQVNMPFLGSAPAHNLMLPIMPNGSPAQQERSAYGGRVITANAKENYVEIESDDSGAWQANAIRQAKRKIISPCAELLIIADCIEKAEAEKAVFILNSYNEYSIKGGTAKANYDGLELCVMPLNWQSENTEVKKVMDGEERPAWQLNMQVPLQNKNMFITAVWVQSGQGFEFVKNSKGFEINANQNEHWQLYIKEDGIYIEEK